MTSVVAEVRPRPLTKPGWGESATCFTGVIYLFVSEYGRSCGFSSRGFGSFWNAVLCYQ
jgi:hypothetical protein